MTNVRWRSTAFLFTAHLGEVAAATNETVVYQDCCEEAGKDNDFFNVPSWALPVGIAVLLLLTLAGSLAGSPVLQAWCRNSMEACLKRWRAWRSSSQNSRAVMPTEVDCESGCRAGEKEQSSPTDDEGGCLSSVMPAVSSSALSGSSNAAAETAEALPDEEGSRDGQDSARSANIGAGTVLPEREADAGCGSDLQSGPLPQDGAGAWPQEDQQRARARGSGQSKAIRLGPGEDEEGQASFPEDKHRNLIVDQGNLVLHGARGR